MGLRLVRQGSRVGIFDTVLAGVSTMTKIDAYEFELLSAFGKDQTLIALASRAETKEGDELSRGQSRRITLR